MASYHGVDISVDLTWLELKAPLFCIGMVLFHQALGILRPLPLWSQALRSTLGWVVRRHEDKWFSFSLFVIAFLNFLLHSSILIPFQTWFLKIKFMKQVKYFWHGLLELHCNAKPQFFHLLFQDTTVNFS